LLLAVAAGCAASESPPSFDCEAAGHAAEDLVCADPALAAKDRRLADVYTRSLDKLAATSGGADAIRDLKAYQRGWIDGRNDCWKADDQRRCVDESYDRRIAELEARYLLVEPAEPVFFRCSDGSEIVASFVPTELPTVRLERGDTTEIAWLEPAASGARYEAPFGIVFWTQGDEAMVEWPQGAKFRCRVDD
jgi:uncharacterized protein